MPISCILFLYVITIGGVSVKCFIEINPFHCIFNGCRFPTNAFCWPWVIRTIGLITEFICMLETISNDLLKGMEDFSNQRMSHESSDSNKIKITQNTEKCPGDFVVF